MRHPGWYVDSGDGTTNFGLHHAAMDAPGPLMQVLRVLRRIKKNLLDQPAQRSAAPQAFDGGIFDGNLFSSASAQAGAEADRHEEESEGVWQPPPSLAEEWISLVDRTFLRMRRALQKPDLGTVIGGRSYGPYDEQPAAPDFATLQAIGHVEYRLGSIDRHLGSISYTLETIAEHIYKRTTEPVAGPAADDGDVSPPADASPPDDYDDGDRGDNL